MTKDDLIRSNLVQVSAYGRSIQNNTFTVPKIYPKTDLGRTMFEQARNEMARAIIFDMNWRKFQEFISLCHQTLTPTEEDKAIELSDFLIKVYESTPETWELFWEGKQPDNPKKMPFRCEGESHPIFIDMTEIRAISIGSMGFKTEQSTLGKEILNNKVYYN